MNSDDCLIRKSATEVVAMLRTREITAHDCLDALEARIAVADGAVNALPTLCFERARAHADNIAGKAHLGILAGLPIAIKDLCEVRGVRTTFGSPIFAHHVSAQSDPLVERLEQQDGIIYAKSNTPEFGSGANTFNEVFGRTRNPWNTSRSAAGSSGGAAAALATGTAWLAHGSDLGGSLRHPASFCGVVGLRPSAGRVAGHSGYPIDQQLLVEGPMGRTVEDVAMFLDALSAGDLRDPVSMPAPTSSFFDAARSGWRPKRIAFSSDLGITPVDPEVADICRKAAFRFAEISASVVEAHPDFSEAHDTFNVLRARIYAISKLDLLRTRRAQLKPEIVWNIEQGLKLTMADEERAERQRAELYRRSLAFFSQFDLLCTPTTIVPPYAIEKRYVDECNGVKFDNYIQWFSIAYAFSLVNCPALSLPCGFTQDRLPVGLQIVARPRAEGRLLASAKLLEEMLEINPKTPIDPYVTHQ